MLYCKACHRQYPDYSTVYVCTCGHYLQYRGEPVRLNPTDLVSADRTIWRYRHWLPVPPQFTTTLGEGGSPLVLTNVDGVGVSLKLDYLSPTGSFKDRGAAVMVSMIRSFGVPHVLEDSSGNGGAAVAAYCARAGIACDIYVPTSTSTAKMGQVMASGAKLVRVPGSRENTARAAQDAARDTYYASHNYNPFFLMGMKTLAYELWEQSGGQELDNVVVPSGYGSALLGCFYGFTDLLEAGLIQRMPRLYAIQADRCAPVERAFRLGLAQVERIEPEGETIAEGIRCVRPVRGDEILRAIQTSDGGVLAVSETEILDAWHLLAREGFYVEPTSATAMAGLRRLVGRGQVQPEEQTIVLLTGSGLKAGLPT